MVLTPLGLIPASLEDLNPFAHLDAPAWVQRHEPEAAWIERELQRLGLSEVAFATVDVAGDGMKQRLAEALDSLNLANEVHQPMDQSQRDRSRENLRIAQGMSKQMVLLNASHEMASSIMAGASFVVNREGRVKNINGNDDKRYRRQNSRRRWGLTTHQPTQAFMVRLRPRYLGDDHGG